MERLTKRCINGIDISNASHKLSGDNKSLFNRPEDYLGIVVSRLADYEDAEEQGLLVKLPCKVGDTVWVRYMECYEFKEENCTDHEGSCESCPHRQPRGIEKQFNYDDIPRWGVGVFATREEAEAEMKEKETENGTD